MRIIQNLKIRNKLMLIAISSLAVTIAVAVTLLLSLRTAMLEDRHLQIKNVVETAYGTLQHYNELVGEGKLSIEQAQKQALESLKGTFYSGNEYFWINDMRPVMIMHPIKPELDGKNLSDMKDANGKHLFIEFVDTVKQHQAGYVEYLWPKPNYEKPQPKVSYVMGFAPWGWIIGSGLYIDDVITSFWLKVKWLSFIVGLFICVVGSITWFVAKDLLTLVHQNVAIINRLGKGDISMTIPVDRHDEFGEMAKSLTIMITNLRQTVSDISGATETLAASSEELSATSEDLNKGSQELASQTEQVVTAMTEVSQTVMDMAKNASQAAEGSKTASDTAAKGKAVIDSTTQGMAAIATTVQSAASTIEELGKSSAQIGEIVAVINGIADQTNLLALNAAIEAARAGEQGRGFAVVADEVRKLAERTSQATKDIGQRIKAIQQAASESVEAMKKGSDEVGKGVGLASQASASLTSIVTASTSAMDMVQRIAAATEQQSAASEEVSQNMEHISEITKHSAGSTAQITQSADDLAKLAMQLKEMAAWFKMSSSVPDKALAKK